MRILVSGATGFVGRVLCRHLAAQGHDVRAFSRRPEGASIEGVIDVIGWDAATQEPAAEAFDGVDAVIHLAGESVVGRWSDAKKASIRSSRVDSTRLLVSAMAKLPTPPATLISASAIGYYGDRAEETLTEEAEAGDDFLASTAVEWENEAQRAGSAQTYAKRYALCAALGIVTGDDDDGGPAVECIDDKQKGILLDWIANTETDTDKFLAWLKVDCIESIPTTRYSEALAMLKKKEAAQ